MLYYLILHYFVLYDVMLCYILYYIVFLKSYYILSYFFYVILYYLWNPFNRSHIYIYVCMYVCNVCNVLMY